jgi:F0F1-type ATP synthase assembly protein I
MIPINQEDVAGIPEIALSIPDFEGQAILRLFSNSTQNEIGCFAAEITNGYTFQHKAAVGSILGAFTLLAILSSFATAAYGSDVVIMRRHYAHSISVSLVFAVWHHIFYSGAFSMNWPSVLGRFWSNYAWSAGMIYTESMQNTINDFIGSNKGNTSQVGAAGTGERNPGLGGGVDIQQIYKRDTLPETMAMQSALAKRHLVDASSGFKYYGQPVKPGLPLPGNYSGFAGTLATQRIPASNAFMTGLLWFLVLIGGVVASIFVLKVALEGLSRTRLIKHDRLGFFRAHYLTYITAAVLRTLFIGFFVMTFLTMFQFSYLALSGPVAVACVVFVVVVFGVGSLAAYACFARLRVGKYISEPDRVNIEMRKICALFPLFKISRNSTTPRSEDKIYIGSVPWWTVHTTAEATSIHDDVRCTMKFGWLTSRYFRTRWWFFVVWLFYEFVRACFFAGASSQPLTQAFGLLTVEIVAFTSFICLHPFESQRLNIMVLYLLGFSKITTAGLSAAFDQRFGVARIPAVVIGIVIIVIQGFLTIALMIVILIGSVSAYMSVLRNKEQIKPKSWNPMRERYFERMDVEAEDIPRPRPVKIQSMPEVPRAPYFEVKQVRRVAKVEDEDNECMQDFQDDPSVSQLLLPHSTGGEATTRPAQRNRTGSLQSQTSYSSLPRAARLHRPFWNAQSYVDSPDRHGALSNKKQLSPEDADRSSHRAQSPYTNTMGSQSSVDRHPSPLNEDRSQSDTPPISSLAPSYAESDTVSPNRHTPSRLTSVSWSSSRPHLERRISEEDITPISRKT